MGKDGRMGNVAKVRGVKRYAQVVAQTLAAEPGIGAWHTM